MATTSNLKVAASQANLSPQENQQVDGLSKLLDSHRSLLAMPTTQAQAAFAALPQDQQNAHVALFGGQDPAIPSQQGWLGSAFHYLTNSVKQAIVLPFKALNDVSNFMTRLYRTGAIALDQNVDLGKAFSIASADGKNVFSPDRIHNARQKFGNDIISVAMKVAAGTPLDQIVATGTDTEKQIAATAQTDRLFQDALDAVQAAKYSPGRQLANLLLPEGMEGSGFLYKGISGITDAAYRIFVDPTLALGKAKKAYDAANYALFKIVGNAQNVDKAFANQNVVKFFNTYGEQLGKLADARKANDVKAGADAAAMLKRIAPEFGPAAQDEFIKAGVRDAATARNYLQNTTDLKQILAGQAARTTPLIPRLDAPRQARIAFLTGADKVFNIDKVGQKIVDALYGDKDIQQQDIINGLNLNAELIAPMERQVGKLKQDGSYRLSFNQINGKIDRFAAKFTTIPYFKNGFFDVNSSDASTQVYRLARLANSKYHSKIIQEAFAAGDEGQRKQIFTGLWNTVAEIRGVSRTEAGQTYMSEFAGKGLNKQYAADIVKPGMDKHYNPALVDNEQTALFPYQLSSAMAVPSIVDLDRLSARSGLINRMFGVSHQSWAEKMTSMWSIGTLAGPRFPVRNAAEDLMIHIAVGDSPWGIVKGRLLSTKMREVGAGDLGFVNKLIKRKSQANYQAAINNAVANGDVNAMQKIMAKAIAEDSVVRKLDERGTQILSDIIEHGNAQDTLQAVSEGGKNAVRGGDVYLNTANDVSRFGKMGAIEINGTKYKQAVGDKGFTQMNPVANTQSRLSWLVQLGITSNDGLARIAVENLNDEKTAVAEMTKYLDGLNPKLRNRFQMYAKGVTTQDHAQRAYDAVKNLYSKADGTLNEDLWNKVIKTDKLGNRVVSTKDLRLEDLPNTADLAPTFIHGPNLIPVSESNNFAASLMDKTWDYMGEANSRFSRDGIVIDAQIQTIKDMQDSGYWNHYMEQMTKGLTGDDLKVAEMNAKRHLVSLAEERAKNRVLTYVDNPAVRSQLAMSVRNFARFYRATEDFYRRVYRTVRYNPEALTRGSLTYEGIAHSGFVQTDDNGDQYFFYPGLTPVYKVMNKVLRVFGVKDAFQTPMPVEFGAKLKMITPSLNPDSLFPTFAGPLAAVPIQVVGNIVPQVKDLEQYLTGSYGQDQPLISAVLPSHVNRLLAALSTDERNSQAASAARKAATYLEASGHGLKTTIDPATGQEVPPSAGELAAYQDKLQASTMTILALRFLFGFAAPASPQITLKSDMAQWVRDNGRTSYKQVFNQLIQQYSKQTPTQLGGLTPIDKATQDWIRYFPNEMPYTISETEATTNAQVRAVTQAGNWIEKNGDLLKKYPQGAAYLIPQAGAFDFNAYKLLKTQGLKVNKTLTDFVRQVNSAKDAQIYYSTKAQYEQQLAMTPSTDLKRMLRQQWSDWETQFKGARPFLQDQLGQGAQKQIERTRAVDDLRMMLNDSKVQNVLKAQPNTVSTLRQMLNAYDQYIQSRDLASQPSLGMSQDYKDMLKQNADNQLQMIAAGNANAQAAYNTLFSRLL